MANSSPVTYHTSLAARSSVQRGFALLITITLLAFLVVLLVGLASYMRVETAVAGNTQRQTQARQNALMALDVALGQLQKYAGPDQRVTATADAFGGKTGTNHFTGVWQVDPASTTPTLLTWLVSGNELQGGSAPLSILPNTSFTTTDSVELVGTHTSGTARDVVAKLQPVTTVGAPGVAGSAAVTIGRYAWWVGDQGVKAPVAVADNSASVTYAPWDSAELRSRLRQQIPLGAGPADASGNAVVEPRDAVNSLLVANQKVTAYNQLAFLRNSSAAAIGLAPLKTYYHAWSPNNFAVLANTKLGGLRQDLSIDPTLLGSAFAAWANYDPANGGYMEDFKSPTIPVPTPAYSADPVRRRHAIRAPVTDADLTFTNAPILSFFFIQFNVRRVGGSSASSSVNALEVRARMVAQLWNLWTDAIVPEALRLEIRGLPTITVNDSNGGSHSVSLQSIFGSPMIVNLTPDDLVSSGDPDDQSWLPGRTYYWRTKGGAQGDWHTEFYNRTLGVANADVWVVPANVSYTLPASNSVELWVEGPATQLSIDLERADGTRLSRTSSPQFTPFTTDRRPVDSNDEYRFGFPFRLIDPVDFVAGGGDGTWLSSVGIDPRKTDIGGAIFHTLSGGTTPSAYIGTTGNSAFSDENRLLDRVMGQSGMSYNEDVPVFELPRAPVLSLGQLQHIQLNSQRPFGIGNSWLGSAQVNGIPLAESFDRFFFSGLTSGVTPTAVNGALLLPNPQLKVLRASSTGLGATAADLRAAGTAQSSKHLLQGGSFSLNSTNTSAWMAVLRSVRLPSQLSFNYLDASSSTGTAADTMTSFQSPDVRFFRFSQSAQEVYKADDNYPQSTGSSSTTGPVINTHLYRRGMRTLTGAQVTALAKAIATAIAAHHATNAAPFRSLEDFLAPMTPGGASLIEQAITDSGVNSSVAEFSSQWLTQGDIMTALAPVLFPRSDTFVIRTYGEAVNPTTGVTEGRAWCEATVQRVPEYFDSSATTGDQAEVAPAALTSTLNQTFGRRFKIVSFRWLTRSDI